MEKRSDIFQAVKLTGAKRTLVWAKRIWGLAEKLSFESEIDYSRREKRRVYDEVATALSEVIGAPPAKTLPALHRLLREEDAEIRGVHADPSPDILSRLGECLLQLRVAYRKSPTGKWEREIETVFLRAGKPTRRSIGEEIDWDGLPAEVRREFFQDGAATVNFALFPVPEKE